MNKHILIISPSFAQNQQDDTVVPPLQIYVRDWLKTYPNDKISIITIHYPFKTDSYKLFDAGIYPMGAANGKVTKRWKFWIRAIRKALELNRVQKIDLVHSFWMNESALVGNRITNKLRVPHFCTAMGQDVLKSNRYLKWVDKSNMQIVVLSQFQKNILEENANVKSEVIPWGISKSEIVSTINFRRPIDLVCVSSLIGLKRVEVFIDLVYQLKMEKHNINCVIIGGGVLEESLRQKVKELNLTEEILFTGELSRRECLKLIGESRALVHTSRYESQGYVLNEALSLGCTVFTLSKGLEITDVKFTISENLEELKEEVNVFLNNQNTGYESVIPFEMKDTIESYRQLYLFKR